MSEGRAELTSEPAGGPVTESAERPPSGGVIDRLKSIALDLAVGFGTLIVLLICVVPFHMIRLHVVLPIAAAVFFLAAVLRAVWSKMNPWIEGIAVSVGALIPVVAVAAAFSHAGNRTLWAYAGLLVLVCCAGAQAQKFWKARPRLASVATLLVLAGVLFAAGKYAIPRLTAGSEYKTMDRPAPGFTLAMLDGTPVTLDSLKGHVVVLDFWGTWCAPCMAEMPTISKVHRQYEANKDVVILAVNPGWNDDTPDKIRGVLRAKHLDVPVALDNAGLARSLGIDALPCLMVIDRSGHIRMEDDGYDENEPLQSELTGQIEQLLKSSAQ